ncbi:MAG: OB-fold-containig protein [Pseudomonadota bacterium]
MINFLLETGMAPFTGALMLVAGLLIVELVMSLIGGSLMGDADGADGLDGADADAAVEFDADGLDAAEIDAGDIDGADLDAEGGDAIEGPATGGGIAAWLGFGRVPFILWLAGLLTAFGLVGYGIQAAASSALGTLMPWWGAAALAALPALRLGGWFADTLGRMIPKTETTAVRLRSLGDRRGVIAQGTARRGMPAQARVKDGHGNMHYVRVEPADEGVEIPEGTEVLIRGGREPVLKAIPIDDIN